MKSRESLEHGAQCMQTLDATMLCLFILIMLMKKSKLKKITGFRKFRKNDFLNIL